MFLNLNKINKNKIAAWAVHGFTGSGAVLGFLAIIAILNSDAVGAFLWLGLALLIDGLDGTLARKVNVSEQTPNIDGTILDSVIDYLNYVIIPSLMIYWFGMVPGILEIILPAAIFLVSLYTFANLRMKTDDYYFRGLLYHDKEKIQINDILHRRLVNYDHELELDVINDRGFIINQHNTSRLPDDEEHKKIREEENPYRAQQTHYFLWKWEGTRPDIERKGNWNEHGYLLNWPQDIKENNPTAPKQIQFVKYPYFEKGVTDIQDKGYITDGKLVEKHNTEYTIKEIKGGK